MRTHPPLTEQPDCPERAATDAKRLIKRARAVSEGREI